MTDGAGNYTLRSYDALGHVLTEKVYAPDNTLASSLSNEYDDAGNVSEAARELGVSRSALYRRLQHHGLKAQG